MRSKGEMEMNRYRAFDDAMQDLLGTCRPAVSRVSGGDINRAYRLASSGASIFMKANRRENAPFFEAEVSGLNAIAETGTIRVPEVLGIGLDDHYGAFLLLEWAEGRQGKHFYETFGRNLAAMHLADPSEFVHGGIFGFDTDNFIGAGAQENRPEEKWTEFFRMHRLFPQFRKAEGYFDGNDRRRMTALLDHLDSFLPEPETPSLLHGDLWSGNYIVGKDGEAWLIDPAVYVGHHEADLAMTELFGGFPQRFYSAYGEVNPIDRDYPKRRELYNLYHLLNHLNLFGPAYLGSVRHVLNTYA